jgi:hypothetical protein
VVRPPVCGGTSDLVSGNRQRPGCKQIRVPSPRGASLARDAMTEPPHSWRSRTTGAGRQPVPGDRQDGVLPAVARAFGVPFHMLQFGHATASFSLGGLDLQYASGGPGWLANTVALSNCADPFVLLDEIEKAEVDSQHDPRAAPYSLWDDSAAAFVDDGLKFPWDLSGIRWSNACTTTSLVRRPAPELPLAARTLPCHQAHCSQTSGANPPLRTSAWRTNFPRACIARCAGCLKVLWRPPTVGPSGCSVT